MSTNISQDNYCNTCDKQLRSKLGYIGYIKSKQHNENERRINNEADTLEFEITL